MATKDLSDVKHVVVLMQENRSFDHYFGALKGVRGFGDRTALVQPNGKSVFYQPDSGRSDGGYLLPFELDAGAGDGQGQYSLPHEWDNQHAAVAGGKNDGWVAAKGERTMGYFTRAEIPFHYALADAFTICDSYFCSIQSSTTPNRLYHWTGTIDPEGLHGGPATGNPADYQAVYSWKTYPEQLQDAGVTWQVYANDEVGDNAVIYPYLGDFGDNPLWLFDAYHDQKNAELIARGSITPWKPALPIVYDSSVGHVLSKFVADCRTGSLPAVSWIVAPYAYSEHPAGKPADGADYVQLVLKSIWANPDLWKSTVVIVNYDENDGFFDHVPPPMPAAGTVGEFVNNTPIGLGVRVPLLAISPWSRGGWVNSQVFDHTSVLQFLEKWTGVRNENISPWRRSICGDLTSCFDFNNPDTSIPTLPDATALRAQADSRLGIPIIVNPPAPGKQKFPVQEPGAKPARALPYAPVANGSVGSDGKLAVVFANTGQSALQLAAYRADGQTDGPWRYDIDAAGSTSVSWDISAQGGKYNIAVHGPNRFLWTLAGSGASPIDVTASYNPDSNLRLTIANHGASPATITVTANHYRTDGPWTYPIAAGEKLTHDWDVQNNGQGWYDLTLTVDTDPGFKRSYIGHAENGNDSITG